MANKLGTVGNPINIDDAPSGLCSSHVSIDLTVSDDENENEPIHMRAPQALQAQEKGRHAMSSDAVPPNATVSDDKSADVGSALDDCGRQRLEQTVGIDKEVKQPVLSAQTDTHNKHTSNVQRSTRKDKLCTPSTNPILHSATVTGDKGQRSFQQGLSALSTGSLCTSDSHNQAYVAPVDTDDEGQS